MKSSQYYIDIVGKGFVKTLALLFMGGMFCWLLKMPEIKIFNLSIPVSLFRISSLLFSSIMANQIIKWNNDYGTALNENIPPVVSALFFIAYILLLGSIILATFWPIFIAIFLVDILVINALCRRKVFSKQKWIPEDYTEFYKFLGRLIGIVIILITSVIFFIKPSNLLAPDYFIVLPPLLLIIPRVLMGCPLLRKDHDQLGKYIWFTNFSVFIFLCSGAYFGYCWLIKQISDIIKKNGLWLDEKGQFQSDLCAEHLIIIFVFMGLMGLFSHYYVFPISGDNISDDKKKKNK